MENQDLISRIKYLMGVMGLRQNAFANRVGTNVSNFSKQLNGKLAVGESLINKIVISMGVSKKWLTTGEGIPFEKATLPAAVNGMVAEQGVPVYDIDVTAGTMSREMIFADERIVGHINVPGVSRDCRIVRVSGDSMSPVINSGDYIAVRQVSDMSILYWGQIYVVLLDDYRMVKYLRRHERNDMVTLRSENPAYDDIDLPRSAIRALFFVDSIIHIDTRM